MGDIYPTSKCRIHRKDVQAWTVRSYQTCYYCCRLLRDLFPPKDGESYKPNMFLAYYEPDSDEGEDCCD